MVLQSCDKCYQSFHTDCIPCLDSLSKIKFGVTNNICVKCHDCPLMLIRGLKICGYQCGNCGGKFTSDDKIAYECSKCYFRRKLHPFFHEREEENNIDPDDGNSWLCSACNLPIFSTPFIKSDDTSGKVIFLRDQCANLPKELKGSALHPQQPLFLQENLLLIQTSSTTPYYCLYCFAPICGSMFYYCPDPDCGFQLDVLCALTTSIKILHRSRLHRLMAIRGAGFSSLICGACGTQHKTRSALSYVCSPCGFWIHPQCASLPNIIVLQHDQHQHMHPLVLNYSSKLDDCAICGSFMIDPSLGAYSCIKCQRYSVHIMCAVSDPRSFMPLLIREAELPGVVSFPIPDERTSVIRYITDNTTNTTASGKSSGNSDDDDGLLRLHEHPVSFHDDKNDDEDDGNTSRVCSPSVQSISPPFYSCRECSDFFLHNCCAHLPRTLTMHPRHAHQLFLSQNDPRESTTLPMYCCKQLSNGFSYSCRTCSYNLDVLCALMPSSITHDTHNKTHILYLNSGINQPSKFDCCDFLGGGFFYECRTCRSFGIHTRCALLPKIVTHRFDQHPLKLIATASNYKWPESSSSRQQLNQLCEICERYIDNGIWYYSCDKCDQSFHTDCIPCLDSLSKIKFGVTNNICVKCHDCPLMLIRGLKICGYQCGNCGGKFTSDDKIAYERSKCYFRIHEDCARECLRKSRHENHMD